MNRIAVFLLSMCLCFVPVVSFGSNAHEEEGIEEVLFWDIPVVVSSTLAELELHNAPSNMSVVTEKDIERTGLRTLLDVLENVPGLIVRDGYIGTHSLILRGIYSLNDKFKLLLNGHQIAEPMWGVFTEYFNMSLENVKQIEIIRGPGSCLYGTNAFAGVINVITKSPAEINGGKVAVKYGSYDTRLVDVVYGKAHKTFGFSLHVNSQQSDSSDISFEKDRLFGTPLTIAPGRINDAYKRNSVYVNCQAGKFEMTGVYVDSEIGMNLPELRYLTERRMDKFEEFWFLESKYKTSLSDRIIVQLKLSYDGMSFQEAGQFFPNGFVIPLDLDGDGDIEYFPNGTNVDFGYQSGMFGSELLLEARLSERNKLLLGFLYENTKTNDIYIKSEAHPLYLYNADGLLDVSDTHAWNKNAARHVTGVFIQDEWDIFIDWYLIMGARYDHYSDIGYSFNPRCGLVWHFNQDKKGILKLLYGSAFKAPNFSQLYNQNNPSLLGNPNLKPETLKSVELTGHYMLNQRFGMNGSIYHTKTNKLIYQSSTRDLSLPGGPKHYINKGKINVKGLEIGGKFFVHHNASFFVDYSYTDTHDKLNDTQTAWVPYNQFSMGWDISFNAHCHWNINLDHTGKIPREKGDNRVSLSDVSVVNTTFRLENQRRFDFYFSILNVFDEDVYTSAWLSDFPSSDMLNRGRMYSAGVSYAF